MNVLNISLAKLKFTLFLLLQVHLMECLGQIRTSEGNGLCVQHQAVKPRNTSGSSALVPHLSAFHDAAFQSRMAGFRLQ